MSNQTIDNALVRQFSDMFHIEAQQSVSKTAPFIEFKSMTGDDFAYDSFGSVEDQKVTGRNQRIEFSDADYSRRKLSRERFTVPVPIDSSDVRGMLIDPQGPIINACMAALNRRKDRIVSEAAFADVQTGREFGTTVTFAGDNGLTVNATAGMTYEKALEIRNNFIKRDVDPSKVGLFITEQEMDQLFKETELTSSDFILQKPIPGGRMANALGMTFIEFGSTPVKTNPILAVNTSIRDCIAVASTTSNSGICMGISKDISVKVQERTDLIETTQVVVSMEVGAVRTEGTLVQKVQTTAV
jgi:hypothetical protein